MALVGRKGVLRWYQVTPTPRFLLKPRRQEWRGTQISASDCESAELAGKRGRVHGANPGDARASPSTQKLDDCPEPPARTAEPNLLSRL
jgi:hypothetical protein